MLNIAFISSMCDLIAPAYEITATSEVASVGAFYRQPPCCRRRDLNRVLCDDREGLALPVLRPHRGVPNAGRDWVGEKLGLTVPVWLSNQCCICSARSDDVNRSDATCCLAAAGREELTRWSEVSSVFWRPRVSEDGVLVPCGRRRPRHSAPRLSGSRTIPRRRGGCLRISRWASTNDPCCSR
jgi:hypothetical protein